MVRQLIRILNTGYPGILYHYYPQLKNQVKENKQLQNHRPVQLGK
jgi:hypothetical protein